MLGWEFLHFIVIPLGSNSVACHSRQDNFGMGMGDVVSPWVNPYIDRYIHSKSDITIPHDRNKRVAIAILHPRSAEHHNPHKHTYIPNHQLSTSKPTQAKTIIIIITTPSSIPPSIHPNL